MKRLAALVFLAAPAPALAHEGEAGWTLSPGIVLPLALALMVYAIGFVRLRARAGRGRGALSRSAWLYGLGWLSLAGALVSPLHEAGERSFTFHMIEHEIVMLFSALLLVVARPGPVLLWGLPRPLRNAAAATARFPVWRSLTGPLTATAVQGAAIWIWHMPALFDLALRSEAWHAVQHLSFLVTALLFWWAMANGAHGRQSHAIAALCLFATSMIGGALGALMALSVSPWYAPYAALGMTPWGLSPAEDQQLAGLIMWIPGGFVHLGGAFYFFARWFHAAEAKHAH